MEISEVLTLLQLGRTYNTPDLIGVSDEDLLQMAVRICEKSRAHRERENGRFLHKTGVLF